MFSSLLRYTPILACVFLTTTSSDGQELVQSWRYTFEQPAGHWGSTDFDDKDWKLGDGGFGTSNTPGARVGTNWDGNDVWLRKTFSLESIPQKPGLLMHHDDGVEVYINGVEVATLTGWTNDYSITALDAKGKSALKIGENTLAVHCHQDAGGQYIDVHLVDADNPKKLPKIKPFATELMTEWGAGVTAENAWTEYPRPQLVRKNWTNLNGQWDYAVTDISQTEVPDAWSGKILVPFCLESKLGGVQEALGDDETLWYHRTFTTSEIDKQRCLLNFEAVDYRCEVMVNGKPVGEHQGGNTPFSFDITDALIEGDNSLVVRVTDATEEWQLRGKQVRNPHGIFYTQVSGIWQTVWLETVPATHIRDLTIHTDAGRGEIVVDPEVSGKTGVKSMRVEVIDGDQVVAELTGPANAMTLKLDNAKLWSPTTPFLYDLKISLLGDDNNEIDTVKSYAGIRTVAKVRDQNGDLRMSLNGKAIFHWGPLDQGWWPDGLLTPPSDEAMVFEIDWLKSAGFNMIRKHIKVEPRRYYYHCDKIGMLVWQDQVSGGVNPKWTFLEPNPTDAEWPDDEHRQFMLELDRMVDELENHPSIVVWVPFNEAWGQHRTIEVGQWIVKRDPSRLINIASGGNFWPVGDIVDRHAYPHPDFPFDADRYKDYVKVVGEFGGHGLPVDGHLWDPSRNNWGYGGLPKTKDEYRDRYVKSLDILDDLRQQGIAGGVYTQTTDVEGEINGLMTYDRKVIKIPADQLREMHQKLHSQD